MDEGQRIKGHRLVLSNISSNELKWNPFNGTWISGKIFSYIFSKIKTVEGIKDIKILGFLSHNPLVSLLSKNKKGFNGF